MFPAGWLWSICGKTAGLFLRQWRLFLSFFLGISVATTVAWKLWPVPSASPVQMCSKESAKQSIPVLEIKKAIKIKRSAKNRKTVSRVVAQKFSESGVLTESTTSDMMSTTEGVGDSFVREESVSVQAPAVPRFSMGMEYGPLCGRSWGCASGNVGYRAYGPVWATGSFGQGNVKIGLRIEF